MASIERTAYPRFKRNPLANELDALYTPKEDELHFANTLSRKEPTRFCILLLLKAFQRLGYFPDVTVIPSDIVQHIRTASGIGSEVSPVYSDLKTLYRHHQAIRQHLGVAAWNDDGLRVASEAMAAAAEVMDNPADLINVAIEELVRQRIELPAFSTLDRHSRRIRALANSRIFETVLKRLSLSEREELDTLLEVGINPSKKSLFFAIKQLPKRPSLGHLQDLLDHIVKLSDMVGSDPHLQGIPYAKIKHFAAEAKALDAAEIKQFSPPKRYVLILSMIHRARIRARDDLANLFIKRISQIHRRGKDELERLRIKFRQKTEHLVATLANVIDVLETQPEDEEAGRSIRTLLAKHGGAAALHDDCAAINAVGGDNYFPLLWRFYRSHRPALFRMLRLLDMTSTTEDTSLMQALDVLLKHEHRKSVLIDDTVDFSFTNGRWKRTVQVKTEDGERINRQHFEVCVFSALAAEIKSGDVAIRGSEAYADYCGQLLSWEECEPLVDDYCQHTALQNNAQAFVNNLRDVLTQKAAEVDAGFPNNKALGSVDITIETR